MINAIRTVTSRIERQMIEDAFGLVALVVILVGGLHLPALI